VRINVCQICGREFEASADRSKYCQGRCFRKKEAIYSRARYSTFSPARRRASALVATARYQGRLVPQPCEVCGRSYSIAHHDDYAAPLAVRWLCRAHHRQHHLKFGPGENA
jgi:hypothetical protein